MKNQLAALELKALASELQQLAGSRLDQVYDLVGNISEPGKRLVFQLATSESKRFLVAVAPFGVFASPSRPNTEGPGSFCSLLRHHLENARLLSISQLGSERILECVFSSKNRILVELFSKGNVILVDDQNVIVGAAQHQVWKDRTVRPGFTYSPPPATADFSAISEQQFFKIILSSEKDSIVKALAVDCGLSGAYAEEVCSAASVDKLNKPSQLSQAESGRLFSSLKELLSRKLQPLAVLDNGSIVEAFPFPTAATTIAKIKPFPSFNNAVEALLLLMLESSISASRTSKSSRQVKEMEIAILQQKATIAEMEKGVRENTRAAELIYEHYQDVKQILDDYNRLRRTFTPEQLREYFAANRKIKSIDEKAGTITLEID